MSAMGARARATSMTGLFLIRTVTPLRTQIDFEHIFVRSVPKAEAHRSPLYLCAVVRLDGFRIRFDSDFFLRLIGFHFSSQ
jgi:hypothetical protein